MYSKCPILFVVFTFLLLASHYSAYAQGFEFIEDDILQARVGNSSYYIDIEGNESGYPGSIYHGERNYNGNDYRIETMNLASLGFQDSLSVIPLSFNSRQLENDSTLAIYLNGPTALNMENLNVCLKWMIDGEWLRFDAKVTTADTIHFYNDFLFNYNSDELSECDFINATCTINKDISSIYSYTVFLQNGVILKNNNLKCEVILDNPFYGHFRRNTLGISNDICFSVDHQSTLDEGPKVHSIIAQGDTIQRSGRLRISHINEKKYSTIGILPTFSPHADGSEYTIVNVADDFPLGASYRIMTTRDDDSGVVESSLVRILEDYPKFNIAIVTLMDGIMNFYEISDFDGGWILDAANISVYDLEGRLGQQSLRVEVQEDTFCTVSRQQNLFSSEGINLSVDYRPLEEISEGNGISLVVHNSDSSHYFESEIEGFGTAVGNWYTHTFAIPAQSDSAPYTIRIKNSGSTLLLDNFSLTIDGNPVTQINGDFESGNTNIYYDTPANNWWSAHGRIDLRNAPEEYLDFLDRLQSDRMDYGYEDRVDLGLHGCHHTAHGKFVGHNNSWEFSYNVDEWQNTAMDSTVSIARQIGFSEESCWAFRSPGLQYHHNTVQACARNGVRWMDAGQYVRGAFLSPFYCPGGGATWLHSHQQWLDVPDVYGSNLDHTRFVLDKGGIVQWGFHPYQAICQDEDRYSWFTGLIETMESEYQNLTWDTPSKLLNRIDYIENTSTISSSLDSNSMILNLEGEYKDGVTLLLYLDSSITLSEMVIIDEEYETPIIRRGDRAFIVLPDLDYGNHSVSFQVTDEIETPEIIPVEPELKIWPIPSNGDIQVKWRHPSLENDVDIKLFNILGREVGVKTVRPESFTVRTSLPTKGLASGIYIVQLKQEEKSLIETKRVIILK